MTATRKPRRKPPLRRDVEHRFARLYSWIGRSNIVVETIFLGQRTLRTGTIATVATTDFGTVSEILVLKEPGRLPIAISLAQVERVYPRDAVSIPDEEA